MNWKLVTDEPPQDESKILLKTKYGILEVNWNATDGCGELYIAHDLTVYGKYWMDVPPPPQP